MESELECMCEREIERKRERIIGTERLIDTEKKGERLSESERNWERD